MLSVIVNETAAPGFPEHMRLTIEHLSGAILVSAMALSASGQTPPIEPVTEPSAQTQVQAQNPQPAPVEPSMPVAVAAPQIAPLPAPTSNAVQELLAFNDVDIKFSLRDLMSILKDSRHEGWVLAAYPDPKTGHPLIGAGFTLDLPAREHPQLDPLNAHAFIEPSSAELWQAAGLDSQRLRTTLAQFDDRLAAWNKRGFRQRIKTLPPQITDEDASQLLRVAIIQAVYNAKGYCRDFDRLSSSQQMALTQLVYQMGVNLQEFSQFLGLINSPIGGSETAVETIAPSTFATDTDYWKSVQQSLVQSQWARLYRIRAVAVIAMLDPEYRDAPGAAEQRVGAMLHPPARHRHTTTSAASRQVSSHTTDGGKGRTGRPGARAKARQRRKRGV